MTSKNPWLKGRALETYLALDGPILVGDVVRIRPCRKDGHYFETDRDYVGRDLEVASIKRDILMGRRFPFAVHADLGTTYPLCMCAIIALKRKS